MHSPSITKDSLEALKRIARYTTGDAENSGPRRLFTAPECHCRLPLKIILVISVLASLGQGCATFDGLTTRRSDADRFLLELEERTGQALETGEALDLNACIAIALDNNLDIRAADLERRLAELNRRIAFANFLPEITFEYTYTELNRAPASSIFGSLETTMQDRIIRETAVQAQMPIFAPATWFLYAIHRRGEEISDIAADYTRQMIALQVTGLYFQCLATRETARTLESQYEAAEVLVKEIEAFHREGMVTDADLAQARVLLMARENALTLNHRSLERNMAELLTVMGISPMAEVELATSAPISRPENGLEAWILEALLNHPRLAIADRLVAIEREKVRIAISDFLPTLAGFAQRSHTSNSFLAYPYVTALGFAGVMTVFNGFANINEYRTARAEEEQAFLTREQESLALMLEVCRAHSNLADARSTLKLARAAEEAAEVSLVEETAKMREGLLRPSEILDRVAERDAAQVNATNAFFQEQVMIALARNVLGKTYRGQKDQTDD